MKIVFDHDGTITDFNHFIDTIAIPYFVKKYNMFVVNPNKLEVEDKLDMKSFFMKCNQCSEQEAEVETKKALNKFWIGPNFIRFSLGGFRVGVRQFLNKKKKEKHQIEIHTSRAKTCDQSIVGAIAREFTILQYRMNGVWIPKKNFHFYENDQKKIEGIIETRPDLAFDDKPQILEQLQKNGIKVICVKGLHNNSIMPNPYLETIETFENIELLEEKINKLIGIKRIKYYSRAKSSDIFFNKLKLLRPFIISTFNPIILHQENIDINNKSQTIYAPNHRSTLDPLIITGIIGINIHWAALLRFFEEKDSIFNNSKNPILCKITSKTFKKLEYFPIDRKSDNPKANNFKSIKDMDGFLKIGEKIGIFAEGTTRRPEGHDFGTFDDAFLHLAKANDAIIRPITTLWIKDLNLKYKVIVNFGQPFKIENMSVEEAMKKFIDIQKSSLQENEQYKKKILIKKL